MNPLRIIAADDHDLLLDGLAAFIKSEPGLELAGKARNGKELIDLALQTVPDIIITDLRMPDMSGIDAIKALHSLSPVPASIILSMFDDDHFVIEAAKAGVMGYVTKGAPKEELAAAIQSVAQNIPYFCISAAGKLVKYFQSKNAGDIEQEPSFTEEEKEVILMLCEGKSTKDICRMLFKSKTVVGEIRARIKKKIGGKHVTDIVKYAIKKGMI